MLWWIYQQLRMSNVQSRLAIVEELLKSDDPEAIGPLMFAVKDKDAGVRCVVAKGLRAADPGRSRQAELTTLRFRLLQTSEQLAGGICERADEF